MSTLGFDVGLALCCAAALYALLALIACLFVSRRHATPTGAGLPVSVLKPLHGAEPRLYQNLRSFCRQDHPAFQLLLGVRDPADPALETARRLQAEFPDVDIDIIVDSRLHGRNRKVSNLINILEAARYPILVIADSDIAVGRDYLRRVCAPLAQPDTGIVTCLYRGRALGGLWSRLGCAFIDEWFAPSVRLTHLFGSRSFAFGATIALRRETLDRIGGLAAIADHLADDYRLGQLTRRAGLRTVLSDYTVATDVAETSAGPLLRRELRWLRTIRSVNPVGYAFMVVSFNIAIAAIGILLTRDATPALWLTAGVVASRVTLHGMVSERPRNWPGLVGTLPLLPVRDVLNLGLWAIGLLGHRVSWGGNELCFDAEGLFRDSVR